jgi:hypothetical protein
MLAIGSILVGAGVLAVGLLALLFRHPRAPRWTRAELVAMLTAIPVTAILGLGLGYIFTGAYRMRQGTGSLYELAMPAAVAIAIAGLWRLAIGGRLRAYGLAAPPIPDAGAAAGPAPAPARAVHRPAA